MCADIVFEVPAHLPGGSGLPPPSCGAACVSALAAQPHQKRYRALCLFIGCCCARLRGVPEHRNSAIAAGRTRREPEGRKEGSDRVPCLGRLSLSLAWRGRSREGSYRVAKKTKPTKPTKPPGPNPANRRGTLAEDSRSFPSVDRTELRNKMTSAPTLINRHSCCCKPLPPCRHRAGGRENKNAVRRHCSHSSKTTRPHTVTHSDNCRTYTG